MPDPVVDLENVSKIYRQGAIEVPALVDVSLEIEPGDFAVLAGPSGSGKTTLLNVIGGLDEPTSGTVRLHGTLLGELSEAKRAELRLRHIGFVFQAYNLIPVLSAYENIEYPLLLQGVPADDRKRRVDELLAAVGLAGLGTRRPAELSGGQQQRVAVARAIAPNPLLVLADEPTANLDTKTGAALVDMMRELNRERGVTFVFSSHDPEVIDRAGRLIKLVDGRVVSDERMTADAA